MAALDELDEEEEDWIAALDELDDED